MPRLIITVNSKELDALVKLSLAELRNPRDQLRYILRGWLIDQKLLENDKVLVKKTISSTGGESDE